MEPTPAPPAVRLTGLRVIFFGMGGVFSRRPLEALLRAGADVRAVVTPAQAGLALARVSVDDAPFTRLDPSPQQRLRRVALPLAGGQAPARSLRDLAADGGAPLFSVARLDDPATLAALAGFAPDAICVACFTQRLPPALLALPRLGCLNAHPSPLPENRGPDPLFWTFHAGASETGVTIHLMDAGLDTGPILAQRREELVEGETEDALEARLATLAGDLMARALAGLASGALSPTPQDAARATTHTWPTADDYAINAANWSARLAYIFVRGVSGRGQPITLIARDGGRFRLIEALGYTEQGGDGVAPWRYAEGSLALACAPGVLTCRAEPLTDV